MIKKLRSNYLKFSQHFSAFCFIIFIIQVSNQNTPQHCWDLDQPYSGEIRDSCGGPFNLELKPKTTAPVCDYGGCSYIDNAQSQIILGNDMDNIWTFTIWFRNSDSSDDTVVMKTKNPPNNMEITLVKLTNSLDITEVTGFTTIPDNLQDYKKGWVMLFLSSSNSGRNIGRYMPGNSHVFKSASNVLPKNMNGKIVRFGSKGPGNKFVNLLRRIEIYKQYTLILQSQVIAIANSKQIFTFDNKSLGRTCPNLITTTAPACQEFFVNFQMTEGQYSNSNQTITDSSSNSNNGINGSTSSSDANDGEVTNDGFKVASGKYMTVSSLSLTQLGYSISFFYRFPTLSGAGSNNLLIQDSNNTLKIYINTQTNKVRFQLDTDDNSSNFIEVSQAITQNTWIFNAFTAINSLKNQSLLQFFAKNGVYQDKTIPRTLPTITQITVGDTIQQIVIKYFRIYRTALGLQTFKNYLNCNLYDCCFNFYHLVNYCQAGQYLNQDTLICTACHDLCTTCTGGMNSNCQSCISGLTLSGSTCECNSQHYHNTSSKNCQSCHASCNECTGATNIQCVNCAANKFYIVGNTSTCLDSCPSGHYTNTSNNTCQPCTVSNCNDCSGGVNSCVCDVSNRYYLSANSCLQCPAKKFLVLGSTHTCQDSCPSGYYQDVSNNNCQPCLVSNCSNCSSDVNICQKCDSANRFYLSSNSCLSCPANKFLTLGSTNTCQEACLSVYYTNQINKTCQPCTDSNCISCSSGVGVCGKCDESKRFYPQSNQCKLCSANKFYVLDNINLCLDVCPEGYQIDFVNKTCNKCDASNRYYLNSNQCQNCPLNKYFVLGSIINTCQDSCPPRYFINTSNKTCQKCTVSNCINCSQGVSICQKCDASKRYFLTTNSICQFCPEYKSLKNNVCLVCDKAGFDIDHASGQCVEVCGDGFRQPQNSIHQCDDGNNQDNDGCSKDCMLQPGFDCKIGHSVETQCKIKQILSISKVQVISSYHLLIQFSSQIHFYKFTKSQITLQNKANGQKLDFDLSEYIVSGDKSNLSISINKNQNISQQTIIFEIKTNQLQSSQIQIPTMLISQVIFPFYQFILPTQEQAITIAGNVIEAGTIGTGITAAAISIAVHTSLQSLWALVNLNQMIYMLPLLNITFPKNSKILFNVLAFANGDFILFVLLYDHTIGALLPQNDTSPYRDRFEQTGYESLSLMGNAGVLIMILFAMIFVLLIAIALRAMCRCNPAVRACANRVLRWLMWNPIIRCSIEIYFDVLFSSVLNIRSFDQIGQSAVSNFNILLSCIFLIILLLFPFFIIRLINAPNNDLKDEQKIQKFGEIYKNFRYEAGIMARLYYPLFCFERLFFVFIVFSLQDHPIAQALLLIVFKVLLNIYVFKLKVMKQKLDRILLMVNEVFMLNIYVVVFALSLINGQNARNIIGYFLIALVIIINCVNLIPIIIGKIQDCRLRRQLKKMSTIRMLKSRAKKKGIKIQPFKQISIQGTRSNSLTQFEVCSPSRVLFKNRKDDDDDDNDVDYYNDEEDFIENSIARQKNSVKQIIKKRKNKNISMEIDHEIIQQSPLEYQDHSYN